MEMWCSHCLGGTGNFPKPGFSYGEMIFPVWLFPLLNSAHLRCTNPAIVFHEAEDKAPPTQTIKRIKVFRNIPPDFTECGQIRTNGWHPMDQSFGQGQSIAFREGRK
jgi:hypothetical protein